MRSKALATGVVSTATQPKNVGVWAKEGQRRLSAHSVKNT